MTAGERMLRVAGGWREPVQFDEMRGRFRPVPVGQLVAIIAARLPSHMRSGIGLAQGRDGYWARFHGLPLRSVFQPIVAGGDGATIGHQGLVRCGSERLLSPWPLFSRAAASADPDWLVALDRLCRTLHAANYFAEAAADQRLFLAVQPGLVTAVARDHGEVFAGILRRMGIAPDRVTIQLPSAGDMTAAHLRAVGESFLARGFSLAIDPRSAGLLAAAGLDFSRPVLVKIKLTGQAVIEPLEPLLAECRRLRRPVWAAGIENEAMLALARAAGCDLLQGFALGRPGPELRTVYA